VKHTDCQDGGKRPRVLPFVWPSLYELTKQAEPRPVLTDALGDARTVLGIAGGLGTDGIDGLNLLFKRRPRVQVTLIIAVYAACPTRHSDLMRLLELQDCSGGTIKFRILLMTELGDGLPANCLVGIPDSSTSPVFVFGPTPGFNWGNIDPTQVNLAFRAPPAVFDEWRKWFDATWLQATPLTEDTAEIPALVPATGSPEAAVLWEGYRALFVSIEPKKCVTVDENGEVQNEVKADGSEDRTPTRKLALPKLDRLALRLTRLFEAGQQVTVNQSNAVRPLDLPIRPSLLDEKSVYHDGTITQRQSFRVSVFSQEELKALENSRKGSQLVIRKLGLPLEKGVYWVPDKVVAILETEINAKNEAAKRKLVTLVGEDAKTFVEGKRGKLNKDLLAVYTRLHGDKRIPPNAITEVSDALTARIESAFREQFVTPVTLTKVQMDFTGTRGWETPWTQAEKLVLALCRFAREAIRKPKLLTGLQTSQADIAAAMDIENDHIRIIASTNRWRAERVARSELNTLKQIEEADLTSQDRCEAGFMLIDGEPPDRIRDFVAEKEARRRWDGT